MMKMCTLSRVRAQFKKIDSDAGFYNLYRTKNIYFYVLCKYVYYNSVHCLYALIVAFNVTYYIFINIVI